MWAAHSFLMLQRFIDSVQHYYFAFIASLPRLGLALAIVIGGILLAGWLSGIFKRRLLHSSRDPLMSRFLSKTIKVALIIVVILLGLNAAGLSGIAAGIFATAGASAIVIGFAFKDIAENFIAGIILAFNRPFNLDETIKIDDTMGKVKSMAFRYTQLKTFDGRDVYIPNADVLKKFVTNFTKDGFFRQDFVVGIAYESDIQQAVAIIQNCMDNADFLVHDEEHINFVVEDNLNVSTVDLKVHFWVTTEDYRRRTLEMRGHLIRLVKEEMDKAGIYLPCDIRELKAYGPDKTLKIEQVNLSQSI